MKKLVVLVVAAVVACVGVLAVSGCTPKPAESDITAFAFLQKDSAGNPVVSMEIVEDESGAQLTMMSPSVPNANISASLDRKTYAGIQKALSKQSFDSWTALEEGQTMEAPASGFSAVVQRRDGTVLGATSDTLSPDAVSFLSDEVSGIITSFVVNRLGIDLGILDNFL